MTEEIRLAPGRVGVVRPLESELSDRLFRSEAFEARLEQFGIAAYPIGVALRQIAIFFMVCVALAIAYSLYGTYAEISSVTGRLWPEEGLAEVFVPRPGALAEYSVTLGQSVAKGERIGRVSYDNATRGSDSRYALQLRLQQDQLRSQLAEIDSSEKLTQQKVIQAEYEQQSSERVLRHMREQIAFQNQVVSTKAEVYKVVSEAAAKSLVPRVQGAQSRSDLLGEERALSLLKMQEQLQLETMVRTSTQIESVNNESRGLTAKREGLMATSRERGLLLEADNALFLTSPISGIVVDLPATVGGFVSPGDPIARISPNPARLKAELWIPSESIGMVKTGATVKLKLSSFPYQRYGTLEGTITLISDAPKRIAAAEASMGTVRFFYKAQAAIERQSIQVGPQEYRLIAGMSLTGDITKERRRLISLVLDPFKAFL